MRVSLFVPLLGLAAAAVGWGQQASAGYGAVTGFVNQAGAEGLPEAMVVLANKALGTQFTMSTSDDGMFLAPAVTPAAGYTLNVSRKQFSTYESKEFSVSAGQTLNFTIVLDASPTVRASEADVALPLVDNTTVGTATLVTAGQIDGLPASFRRPDELIPVAPAMTTAEFNPGVVAARDLPYPNALLLDGIYATNSYYFERPGTAPFISLDAVQGFQVMSSDYPAEYGRTMGGVVNMATRSGTTSYHGSLHEYYRPRALGARDAFALGYYTRQREHQGGADLSGPIWHDKLFFFANFDALYRDAVGLNRIENPLISDPTGRSVSSANCTATPTQCANAVKFLQSQTNVIEPMWEHSWTGLAKIDYRRSERNTFNAEADASHWFSPVGAQTGIVAPNGGLIGDPTMREEYRFAKVGWTGAVTSDTINDLRLGVFENRISLYPAGTPLSTGRLGISIAGTPVGDTQPFTSTLPYERRYQLTDTYHRLFNTHQFRVGLDLSKTRDLITSMPYPAGWYSYASMTAFAQDFTAATGRSYATYSQTFGAPSRVFEWKEYNFYGEDTWRATSRLTLEFALRYEKPKLPTPTVTNPAYFETGSITSPYLDLVPRFGFAYMIDPKTVLRGSFGFYYAPFPGQLIDDLYIGNGLYQPTIFVNPNQAGAPIFPGTFPSITNSPNLGTKTVVFSTTKLEQPYTQDTNVSLERSLWRNTTLSLGYIRTRGLHFWNSTDTNLTTPTVNETYTIDNAAGQAVGTYTTPFYTAKNDNNYGHVYQVGNTGSYWYDALAVQLRMRLAHGFTMETAYTWSHALDTLGQNSAYGFVLNNNSTNDPNSDKGRSALDQRQRAVVRWTWSPTIGGSAIARHAVNGWLFSGVATLATGQGITPLVVVQGQQFSGITMLYTTSLSGAGTWSRVPFLPVNSLNLPSQYDIGARLGRSFRFTERIHAMLALEAYNVLNHQQATMLNPISYVSFGPLAPGLINGPQIGTMKPVAGAGLPVASQSYPDGTNARRAQVVIRFVF